MERTFSPSESFSRISLSGFTYWERFVILFVSNEWIPEPVKSTAVTLKPPSSKRAIVLYQHHAPKPPPWTRTKWLVSRSSSFMSCKNQINKKRILRNKETIQQFLTQPIITFLLSINLHLTILHVPWSKVICYIYTKYLRHTTSRFHIRILNSNSDKWDETSSQSLWCNMIKTSY